MSDPLATSPIHSVPPPAGQRFEFRGRIGAGNHGVVFRALDQQLNREVAVKRFSHFLADDPRAMRRISREVNALARVSHPHVVTVHDLVQLPDGDGEITPHLVMELVEGASLRELLAEHGPSLRSVLVTQGVLEGLAACHEAGILHLDIKPANVLVTSDGGIKIVDFGIARAASDATATIAGTPHYMPPEQYEGQADQRSDIYSVGCLLYECLTGRPPFEGTMAAQLLAHRGDPRPDPRTLSPQVSASLAAVVMRAMAIDPQDRYADVHQMLSALTALELTEYDQNLVHETESVSVASHDSAHLSTGRILATATPPMTRTLKFGGTLVALLVTAFVVALVPGLVWLTTAFPPANDYRPDVMSDANAPAWWLMAVVLAAGFLILKNQSYFAKIGGPPVGSARPDNLIRQQSAAGARMGAAAALRGSLPMLFPWYVAGVAAVATAADMAWPHQTFDSPWTVAWLLMPLAAVVLFLHGLTRIKLRFGALVMAGGYLAGSALAIILFSAYPQVF